MSKINLDQEEIKSLFKTDQNMSNLSQKIFIYIKSTIYFFLIFGLVFIFLNYPAYEKKIKFYFRGTPVDHIEPSNKVQKIISINSDDERLAQEKTAMDALRQKVSDNHLVIPSLNIDVPIIWKSNFDNILKNLENGVVHYDGTSLPGEIGNVFIVGHSSNYWWDPGKFNQVFAVLENIKTSDRIYVGYNNNVYVYEVGEKQIVKPTELEVLNSTDNSIISLMTCYPVGTTLNRMVVRANQIFPSNSISSPKSSDATPIKLPVIR